MDWLSVHLFYNGDLDRVLKACVVPLVDDLRTRGLVDLFFFIRYTDGGLHLRLRFGGLGPVLEERVRPIVEEALRTYLREHPSSIEFTPEVLAAMGVASVERHGVNALPLQPNNSIRYIAYEPETERYGGHAGIGIAEEHFDFSTRMALEVICADPAGDMRRRLGLAMQVLFVFPMGMGCTLSMLAELFKGYRRDLLERYVKEGSESALENAFQSQRPKLVRMARLLASPDGRDPFLIRWHLHSIELAHRLVEAGVGDGPVEEKTRRLTQILVSDLHMFNNRLGIFVNGELYLSYLVQRTCEALAETEASSVEAAS